jgi:hypothetical protein
MATFNFQGDNVVHGDQKIAGRDFHETSHSTQSDVLQILAVLQKNITLALAAEDISQPIGEQASTEVAAAINAVQDEGDEAPRRAEIVLTRAKEILTAAASVPTLVQGVVNAIEAVKSLT